MTNEEAIKLIDDRMCFGRGKWSEHHKPEIDIYWQAGEMAIKALEAEPHWIPVTERLPEEETDVLVTVHFLGLKRTHRNGWNDHIKESYYVEVASHINGEWSSASDEYKIAKDRHKVVAWMPLPEPMSEQYKNKQSNCNKMPLPEPYKGVTE